MNFSKPEGATQVAKLARQYILGDKTGHIPYNLSVFKIHPRAEFPLKERATDSGWDITLISRTENRAEDELNEINEFGTGLSFSPPEGYYLEVVAIPSLHRHGYMLPSPVIIDANNKEELILPLFKFRDSDDIVLPFRAVRLVPKPVVYIHMSQQKKKHITQDNTSQISMSPYQKQIQGYQPGVPRPQASPRGGNHMF